MTEPPFFRGRRLRRTGPLRSLVRETSLTPDRLVQPYFVVEGEGRREPVASMPGVDRISADVLVEEAEVVERLGVGGVLLFGVPGAKDPRGEGAWAEDGVVQRAVRALRSGVPHLPVITDVCLCAYTSHGHCGVLEGEEVANDASLEQLARTAVSHARAGAHMVAPSDMMDGRVAAIRAALDRDGHTTTPILSYAAKYASAFYGPFRDAADSAPASGDRRSYQMDPSNVEEALREVRADIAEGADMVMVKPALAYLDVVHRVKQATGWPVAAYHVSGEYAAIVAAAERGWLDGPQAMTEALVAIRRAGADLVVSYWARAFAERE